MNGFREGRLNGGSLGRALGALEKDLRQALAGTAAVGEVEVEIGLSVEIDGSNVHWELAQPGHPASHHLRFKVQLGPAGKGSGGEYRDQAVRDSVAPSDDDHDGRSTPISDTSVVMDPDLELPPIVRPKPGVRDDDND